jgi:hypothetical protein
VDWFECKARREEHARNKEAEDGGKSRLEDPLPTLFRANGIDLPIQLQREISGDEPEKEYRIIQPASTPVVSAA